jgi:hypothetical protein
VRHASRYRLCFAMSTLGSRDEHSDDQPAVCVNRPCGCLTQCRIADVEIEGFELPLALPCSKTSGLVDRDESMTCQTSGDILYCIARHLADTSSCRPWWMESPRVLQHSRFSNRLQPMSTRSAVAQVRDQHPCSDKQMDDGLNPNMFHVLRRG